MVFNICITLDPKFCVSDVLLLIPYLMNKALVLFFSANQC